MHHSVQIRLCDENTSSSIHFNMGSMWAAVVRTAGGFKKKYKTKTQHPAAKR